MAATLRARGLTVDVLDVAGDLPRDFALEHYAAAVVAASVHMGKHEREMIEFVKKQRSNLLRDTKWRPTRVRAVAGALLYRQYGTLVRLVMRFIAKRAGGTSDTSRDHESTDWAALVHFADEMASLIANGAEIRN